MVDQDAFHSASSQQDAVAAPQAAPAAMQHDSVRATVLDNLHPSFDNKEQLMAFHCQQPAAQRGKEQADQCGIQLGVAALYVQRYVCAPGTVQIHKLMN